MPMPLQTLLNFPADMLTLILEQLIGDSQSLASLSQTCTALYAVCILFLLSEVDLSSHNLGRQQEHQTATLLAFAYVDASYHNKYRPRNNLVARQRAFLCLLTEKPHLAVHVRHLTWTLIWQDVGEDSITDIDRQTWSVFCRVVNVTTLDLASLHEVWEEPYIRQNSERLFSAVTELRLVGWMHRGLVKAIIGALDASKLRSLCLDWLEDEGSMPNGGLMSRFTTLEDAPSAKNRGEQRTFTMQEMQ